MGSGSEVQVPLAHTVLGGGIAGARRLVLCHGFTQNADCWGAFASDLSLDHEVVLVDAPGHGRSGHDSADLDRAASLSGAVGGRAVYVGYSMGGRMALHLALAQPHLVEGLLLIGATAGIDDADERNRRRHADDALADRLIELGLEAFLDRWLAGPLFSSLPASAAARDARLTNRVDGLAASLRSVGTGTQRPLWAELCELAMPVTIVAGEGDAKFTALGRRLAAAIGDNAVLEILPGGHAVHLESPVEVATAVRRLVARVDARS